MNGGAIDAVYTWERLVLKSIFECAACVDMSEESHHAKQKSQRLVVNPLHHRHQTGPLPEGSVEDHRHK